MGTPAFREGIEKLLEIARQGRTCIMCMERDPRYCHRRHIAAYLEALGVEVVHIIRRRSRSLPEFAGGRGLGLELQEGADTHRDRC